MLFLNTAACERVDKAFEAVDKAKNLKMEFEKKAAEVKKDITGKAEEFGEKVKKGADSLGGLPGKDNEVSVSKDTHQKEGKRGRENKEEKE
jgi:hypothetical protein